MKLSVFVIIYLLCDSLLRLLRLFCGDDLYTTTKILSRLIAILRETTTMHVDRER